MRREALVQRLADEYTAQGDEIWGATLWIRSPVRKSIMGAARIAVFDAVRGALRATSLEPEQRQAIERYWGLSGVK